MPRLKIKPGAPGACDVELKPGSNFIGRGFANDCKLDDPSVSGSHCQIIVDQGNVIIRDLGSTNGTMVDRVPIKEAVLKPGQTVHLGSVEMIFEADAAARVSLSEAVPPPPPPPMRHQAAPALHVGPPAVPGLEPAAAAVRVAAPALRVSGHSPQSPEPVAPPEAPPMAAPPPAAPPASGRPANCKFHPKTLARWLCPHCNRTFCDLCVSSRQTSAGQQKTCRSCGVPVNQLHISVSAPMTKGFFARLPGAFIYPFKGFGVAILILAAAVFGAVDYLVNIGFLVGPFAWVIRAGFYGFLFLFMQNIIHTTASDENEPLGFPNVSEVFGAAFQLGATIMLSFGPAIGLLLARLFDAPVPGAAIIAAVVLGCLYFPMAFLAVAMKDSVMAANPLVVFPAILKMPLEYLVSTILLMSVFGLRQVGHMLSSAAGDVSLSTRDMSVLVIALGVQAVWALVSIYLLTVNMRILGLLYITKKDKLEWF